MGQAEDRIEIEDLLVRYARLVDDGRRDEIAGAVFAEDAVVDYGTGEVTGRDAIRGFFTAGAPLDGSAHYVSNFAITIDGDTARSSCYYQSWHWFTDTASFGVLRPVDFVGIGRYDDELRRTSDGWRIVRRNLRTLGPGSVGVGRPPAAWEPMFEARARR